MTSWGRLFGAAGHWTGATVFSNTLCPRNALRSATHSALASAKLAAALSDDDVDEIGMTIAYLKRALKAITVSMEADGQLLIEKLITPQQHSVLQQRLFEVRDGIITLMGQYRGEWLRRFGSL